MQRSGMDALGRGNIGKPNHRLDKLRKRRHYGASFAAASLNLAVGAGAQRMPQLCDLRAQTRGRQRDLWQVQRDAAQATESKNQHGIDVVGVPG